MFINWISYVEAMTVWEFMGIVKFILMFVLSTTTAITIIFAVLSAV
jgi:hypothetical protein